jgi:hypothetical protein
MTENTDSFFDNDQLHLIQHAQNGKIIGEIVNQRVSPDATSTPAFGSVVRYEVKSSGNDQLDDGDIVVDISAIIGSGRTYIRGVNALALFLFKRWEVYQDSTILETTYPENVFQDIRYYSNSDKYSCISQKLAINTSGNRDTLAGSAQKLVIPIKNLFALFSKPLDRAMIKGNLEIRMYLRDDVRYCIQTDKTSPTFSITDTYLDLQYIKAKPIIVNTIRKMYNDNNSVGKPYFNVRHKIVEKSIASSSTSIVLSLPELVDERVIDLCCFLRASALKDTNDASDYTDTFIAPTSWSLKSGGKYINYGLQQDITKSYYDKVIVPRLEFGGWVNLLSGTATGNDFVISFANDHVVESSEYKRYHGARYFNEKDVQLTVNFSSLAAQTDLVVIIRSADRFVCKNGLIRFLN